MSSSASSLSVREQRLLTSTIFLVVTVLIAGAGYKGYDYLRIMDRRISNSEQELLNLHEQTLLSRSVDAAYQQVISQHSTGMSKEEIHDSLRREIDRLALVNPDLPESEKYLIKIPTLPPGVLREEGEGYREYRIRFRVPSCRVIVALAFLKRLEQSNQLLRIDSFELKRSHSAKFVSLTIEVTRTVLSEVEIRVPDDSLSEWDAAVFKGEVGTSGSQIL
ncbi:MAG TPA: hypothetical protein EYN96_03945 [Candidatus Hydrogenedentes bacterium]|nr:hypothetical protein [Candidatus Hydrogenedentota bacterium]